MTFIEFCKFNGIDNPKQFMMLENCIFPQTGGTIDFTVVMFSLGGNAIFRIDGKEKSVRRRYMSVFRAGQSIECISMSKDFKARTLLIGGSLDKSLSISDAFLTLFILDETPVLKVTYEYSRSAELFYEALSKVVGFRDNPYQTECLLSIMRAFFYSTGHYIYKALGFSYKERELQDVAIRLKAFDEDSVIRRFINLVEKYSRTNRTLSFYATKLDYHPKYLSTLIKRRTGHTGQEIIDQYATLIIVAKLSFGDKSIKEISNELEFPSQSDFGKFFKRMTGMSPLQYRKQGKLPPERAKESPDMP